MTKIYKLEETSICCPECERLLESPKEPAHYFIVMAMKGQPPKIGSSSRGEFTCGWCDVMIVATRISETEVEIKTKY